MLCGKRSAGTIAVIASLLLAVCITAPARSSPEPTSVEVVVPDLEQITVRVTAVGDLQATTDNRFTLARDMIGPAEIDLEISNSGPPLAFSVIYDGANPIDPSRYYFYEAYGDIRISTSDEPFATLDEGGKAAFTFTSYPLQWSKDPVLDSIWIYVPSTEQSYRVGDLVLTTPGPAFLWHLRRLFRQVPESLAWLMLGLFIAGGTGGFWLATKRGQHARVTGV